MAQRPPISPLFPYTTLFRSPHAPRLVGPAAASEDPVVGVTARVEVVPAPRSEEHTSELQSRGHLVCRLLLEKKKLMAKGRKVRASRAAQAEVDFSHFPPAVQ